MQDATIPISLPPFAVGRIFLFCCTLCNTSFSLYRLQLIFPILLQKNMPKLPMYFWFIFRSSNC